MKFERMLASTVSKLSQLCKQETGAQIASTLIVSLTSAQTSLEADEAGFSMMIRLRGTTSRPTGVHHASEGRTVSARLPALLEAPSRVVPFIACAIGISCA